MENEETILLERKKLALEIADMERAWWKRPTYILAALPTLLAVIALSVGFLNGFFNAQLTKLDNQKHDLEAQVKAFEDKRDDLHRQYDDAQKKLDDAQKELDRTRQVGKNRDSEAEYQSSRAHKCEQELRAFKPVVSLK